MKKIDFNQGWTVKCLTRAEAEKQVTLPHDAMISEPRSADSAGADNIGYYIGGDYEYTKKFAAAEFPYQTLVIEFESVYMEPEVYLNGEKVMYRPYGYTNFYVDISEKLKDINELRVVAHNMDQPNSRWYSGTGIYRPVFLWGAPREHIAINGIRVKTLSCNPAKISVRVQTNAPGPVEIRIPELNIRITADARKATAFTDILSRTNSEIEAAATINNAGGYDLAYVAETEIDCPGAHLWSTEDPYLYQVTAAFGQDEAETTIGIRTLTVDEKGVCINGERVILRGACIHHDNGPLGACTYPEVELRRVQILKENGYNALRSAHNPCSKYLLDACDKLGVLMMDEFADCWYIHKTRYDYARFARDWWKQDFKDMVDKDYNHPSVIMYSIGNEVAETSEAKGIAMTGDFTEYLHYLDDSRKVSCGINIFFNFLYSIGMGVYSDEKAERAAKKKSAEKKKKKAVGSEFYNLLACKLGDNFMKAGATLPMCDWKTKKAYAKMDVAGYNYGLFRYKSDLKRYPERLILGSETFCKDSYKFYEIAKKNPRILGDFVWAGWDYIGEAGMGSTDFSPYMYEEEEARMTGEFGRIDLNGIPRAEALYTRVAFEQDKGPYIAVLPAYGASKPILSGWKFSKAMESWSWSECVGKKIEIEIYARAAKVEAFVNGRSLGKKQICKRDCRVVYHTTYEEGQIRVISYDETGMVIGEKILKTAGAETVMQVTPERETVEKGGLVYVQIAYTDKEGIWKPEIIRNVHVETENGRFLALSNAAPNTLKNYTENTINTYFGRAMAIVQADGNGDVQIRVSDGTECKSVSVRLI